ncbi:MAG: hypothetical protein INF44_03670 [Thalassospira sp.]|nr:hypothetical protein [Thalassospira sp.]
MNPVDASTKWLAELKLAKREDEKFIERGDRIIRRYRDDRKNFTTYGKRFNILWSNVETLKPALYGKTPRAEVSRRWKDSDPVGRTASVIIERCLQYEIDKGDFDASMRLAISDRLLPGRGTVWVRFEEKELAQPVDALPGEEGGEAQVMPNAPYKYECTPVDYVFWKDVRYSPARCWDEVTWIARRVYMSQDDGIKRFGEDFKQVPLTHEPVGLDEMEKMGVEGLDDMKKAVVWEIWSKTTKQVFWVSEGYSKTLDIKDDPLGLDSFWPCPKPLFATQTTETLVPIPDYSLYQDQAEEIDMLTNRIAKLVEAVKVVGVYDASQQSVQRMLSEGVDNQLISVDTWAAFAEKGGLKGVVDFMPLDSVLQALRECYAAREQAKQVVYEITGISDIIRGSTIASETAAAQQIKSQYASLRIKPRQTEVAQFASEVLRIKAQIMCDFYAPQTLVDMSGIMGTMDAQYAEQAIMLLKSEPARGFRIEVASDSLVEMDEATEKQSRIEFLGAVGQFMDRALPVTQQVPELAPLMGEMLMFGVRAFKGGRMMESAFDEAMAKLNAPKPPEQPQPDPEQMKAEAMMQVEQGKMQLEQAKIQTQGQIEQFKAQQAKELEQMRQEYESAREQVRQEAETQRLQMKAQIEAETKLQIAEMQRSLSEKQAVSVEIAGEEKLNEVGEQVKQMADMQQNAVLQAVEMLAEAVEKMNKPRRKLLQRGEDGRAIGVIEIEED